MTKTGKVIGRGSQWEQRETDTGRYHDTNTRRKGQTDRESRKKPLRRKARYEKKMKTKNRRR